MNCFAAILPVIVVGFVSAGPFAVVFQFLDHVVPSFLSQKGKRNHIGTGLGKGGIFDIIIPISGIEVVFFPVDPVVLGLPQFGMEAVRSGVNNQINK